MSKKRDPIVAVLRYFEDTELPLAQQALTLAKEIVRSRSPKSGSPRTAKPAKPRGVAPAAAAVS